MLRDIKAFDCECERCGHVWFSATVPSRCAKCKSRSWNTSEQPGVGSGVVVAVPVVVVAPVVKSPKKILEPRAEQPAARFNGCAKCGALGGMHFKGCGK